MRDKKLHPKLTLIIIAAVVLLSAGTALVWSRQTKTTNDQKSASTQTEKKPESKLSEVNYDGVDGKNALEILKTKANVITKQSSYGEYVDSVNGVQGGTDGKYWAFYINGQLSQVGAADYQTKAQDKITWKFE